MAKWNARQSSLIDSETAPTCAVGVDWSRGLASIFLEPLQNGGDLVRELVGLPKTGDHVPRVGNGRSHLVEPGEVNRLSSHSHSLGSCRTQRKIGVSFGNAQHLFGCLCLKVLKSKSIFSGFLLLTLWKQVSLKAFCWLVRRDKCKLALRNLMY